MADASVRIRLAADDTASPKINQVKQSLSQLLSQSGTAGTMAGSLLAGGLTAGLTTAVQMAQGAAQAAWDLGVMGAQAERTEASFAALASSVGQSGQAMLASMRTMTAGTVADTDLMLAANRAMMLGVSDNAEEMGQLMAAAIERGRALGVSSQQAVNDVITGIGRMSPEILDNLGIVGAKQSMEEYAHALGMTADQLTEVQKKQALVNAVIASGSGGAVLDDAASSFERMDSAIKNMQGALGQLFSPAIAAMAENLANAVTEMMNPQTTDPFAQSAQLMGGYFGLMGDGFGMVADAAGEMGDGIAQGLGLAEPSINQLMDSIMRMRSEMETLKDAKMSALLRGDADAVDELAIAEFNLVVSLQQASGLLKEKATAAAEAARADEEAAKASADLTASNAALDPLLDRRNARQLAAAQSAAILAQYTEAAAQADAILASVSGSTTSAVDALKGRIMSAAGVTLSAAKAMLLLAQATGIAAGATSKYNFYRDRGISDENASVMVTAWVNQQVAGVDTVIDKFGDLGEQAGTQVAKGLSDAEKAFNDMRGRVSSMLSGALSPDVSIADGILPREDDINENARRVAAIANEGIGDQSWMEEFKNEAPGIFDEIVNAANPQAAAARIFTEFQAGLRPELIDKDLVKQRIKDAILGEQRMDALATEIAQELSQSMGVSLPEALSAAQDALGVSSKGNKDQFGSGFEEGVDAQAAAAGSIAKIAKAFLDNQSSVRSSGNVVGAWWGEGFMAVVGQNVPPGLLEMLTSKLLPAILAAMANQGSTSAPNE